MPTFGIGFRLPFGEGSYDVYPSRRSKGTGWTYARIKMTSAHSGLSYNHPLTIVDNVDHMIDYGWYRHFYVVLQTSALNIRRLE
jgi:hypothetical protein